MPISILVVIGTRPEAIKLAPVVQTLSEKAETVTKVCLTGQHRELLAQGLADFNIPIHYNLHLMSEAQSISDVTARVLTALGPVLKTECPDWVVVQGDTTTAMATALAAFHHGHRVAHVEAGLRTGDVNNPWPEEMNRRLIGQIAQLHFAPTERARSNLLAEGVDDDLIEVCGNTVVDAVQMACRRLDSMAAAPMAVSELLALNEPLILVTLHRRENLSAHKLAMISTALLRIAERGDCTVVFSFHLNPQVEAMAQALTGKHPRLRIVPPLNYLPFISLLRHATVILTDSGGIQEEAAILGKPVLIMRDRTERPEVIEAGNGILVGTDADMIAATISRLMENNGRRQAMEQKTGLFGDGFTARRIAERLASH